MTFLSVAHDLDRARRTRHKSGRDAARVECFERGVEPARADENRIGFPFLRFVNQDVQRITFLDFCRSAQSDPLTLCSRNLRCGCNESFFNMPL